MDSFEKFIRNQIFIRRNKNPNSIFYIKNIDELPEIKLDKNVREQLMQKYKNEFKRYRNINMKNNQNYKRKKKKKL